MKQRLPILLWAYVVTAIGVLGYFVFVAFHLESSQSIALLFLPIFLFVAFVAIAWMETLAFGLFFIRHIKEVPIAMLIGFFITPLIYGAAGYYWFHEPEVVVPMPGTLPVSLAQYSTDRHEIAAAYTRMELDQQKKWERLDSILSVDTDTIIYALDGRRLFAILVIAATSEERPVFLNAHVAGTRSAGDWALSVPHGNTAARTFRQRDSIRTELLHYYYARYSINGSDRNKPEIWDDPYIFKTGD